MTQGDNKENEDLSQHLRRDNRRRAADGRDGGHSLHRDGHEVQPVVSLFGQGDGGIHGRRDASRERVRGDHDQDG